MCKEKKNCSCGCSLNESKKYLSEAINESDKNFIESVLTNDETADDNSMLDYLVTQTGEDPSIIETIIKNERSNYLKDPTYQIDWSKYENQFGVVTESTNRAGWIETYYYDKDLKKWSQMLGSDGTKPYRSANSLAKDIDSHIDYLKRLKNIKPFLFKNPIKLVWGEGNDRSIYVDLNTGERSFVGLPIKESLIKESTEMYCQTCGERLEPEEYAEDKNRKCSNCGDSDWGYSSPNSDSDEYFDESTNLNEGVDLKLKSNSKKEMIKQATIAHDALLNLYNHVEKNDIKKAQVMNLLDDSFTGINKLLTILVVQNSID